MLPWIDSVFYGLALHKGLYPEIWVADAVAHKLLSSYATVLLS
jgi:hypothetical protein